MSPHNETESPSGRLWRVDGATGVTLDRTFAVPVAVLWDRITVPEQLARWYCPVSGSLTPGTLYQMHFGDETGSGVVQRCEPPRSFSATWEHDGEPASLLTVTLTPDGAGQTRLTLEHQRLPDNQAAGHAAGWHSYLDRLAASVSDQPLPEWWPRWEAVIDTYRSQIAAIA